MNIKDNFFIKLLKDNTTIDTKFINTFFKKIKVGSELDFDIKDFHVAKYLEVSLINIRRRLNNEYSKSLKFIDKVDYIKIKSKTSNAGITYMVNFACFEKLAINGESKKSETVRNNLTKLRDFMYIYQ